MRPLLALALRESPVNPLAHSARVLLGRHGRSAHDVLWVGTHDGVYSSSWEAFEALDAHAASWSSVWSRLDLVIAGDGWWLVRSHHPGWVSQTGRWMTQDWRYIEPPVYRPDARPLGDVPADHEPVPHPAQLGPPAPPEVVLNDFIERLGRLTEAQRQQVERQQDDASRFLNELRQNAEAIRREQAAALARRNPAPCQPPDAPCGFLHCRWPMACPACMPAPPPTQYGVVQPLVEAVRSLTASLTGLHTSRIDRVEAPPSEQARRARRRP